MCRGFEYLKHIGSTIGVGVAVWLLWTTSVNAADPNFRKFVGMWKVKETGGFLISTTKYVTWIIREESGKLVVELPARGIIFDEVSVNRGQLVARSEIKKSYEESVDTREFTITVRNDFLDGEMDDVGVRLTLSGHLFPVYNRAKNAEEEFVKKLEDEKKRLGEGIKKLEQFENTINQQKSRILTLENENKKNARTLAQVKKGRNADLKNLGAQYKGQIRDGVRKHSSEVRKLNNSLKTLREKPPRVDVGRMPRNAQAYQEVDLKLKPSKNARTYFKLNANQALIRLANLNNGWSLVATDQGDLGFVQTTRLRSVTGAQPLPSPIESDPGRPKVRDNTPNNTSRIIQLTQPRQGTGSNRNYIVVPAPGFVTFKGNIAAQKVNSFTINGEKVKVGSGGEFRYLIEIENGQQIKMVASTPDGQERLNYRVRIGASN